MDEETKEGQGYNMMKKTSLDDVKEEFQQPMEKSINSEIEIEIQKEDRFDASLELKEVTKSVE